MKMRSKTVSGHESGLIIQCNRQLNRAIMQDFAAGLRRRWGTDLCFDATMTTSSSKSLKRLGKGSQ